jgi:hypothetical protein
VEHSIAPMISISNEPLIHIHSNIGVNNTPLLISRCVVSDIEKTNILYVKYLPDWVDNNILYDISKRFSYSSKNYPKIDIKRNKNEAKIIFNPESCDANFASYVLRKYSITDGKNSCILSFRLPTKKH